jgi:hypothetical protein
MRSVATDLGEWTRPRTEPAITGIPELRARYQERRSPQISERGRLEANTAAAEAALMALHMKWKALGEALHEVDDHAVLDTWGAPEMLERDFSHRGSTTVWEKGSSSKLGEHDWELVLARHVELLSDGLLIPRWSVFVGTHDYMGGAAYVNEGRDYDAPVGSIQQEAMFDRFMTDASHALREALEKWVWTGQLRRCAGSARQATCPVSPTILYAAGVAITNSSLRRCRRPAWTSGLTRDFGSK